MPCSLSASYACAALRVRRALQLTVAELPASSGPRWQLSMPTPDTATIWRPSGFTPNSSAQKLALYLAGENQRTQVWSVVTTPADTLLVSTLLARLDELLPAPQVRGRRLPVQRPATPCGSRRW